MFIALTDTDGKPNVINTDCITNVTESGEPGIFYISFTDSINCAFKGDVLTFAKLLDDEFGRFPSKGFVWALNLHHKK